jgi:sarcosine oxidase subunit gamma
MSGLFFDVGDGAVRVGLKGPRAAEWLAAQRIALPAAPNTWTRSPFGDAQPLLVARLGYTEFLLEDETAGCEIKRLSGALPAAPSGVYPVLREDFAFRLGGEGARDALAQVCNVDFSQLSLSSQPVVMTLMMGVAVVAVPYEDEVGADPGRRYRFWCDPTFGPSLSESLGKVVVECGGTIRGASE